MLSLETWCKSWLYSTLDNCWHLTRVCLTLCQCIESSLVNSAWEMHFALAARSTLNSAGELLRLMSNTNCNGSVHQVPSS